MVEFTTMILQFAEQGEKTGWTYIQIPADLAQQLKPGNKKSFRVKGKLDNYAIKSVALMPMGGGSFIMAVNATMRKGIGKRKGAMLKVQLQEDKATFTICKELKECLQDEPEAQSFFESLPMGHQRYYNKWVEDAKTDVTKANRIARVLNALLNKWSFAEMLRAGKQDKGGW